MAVLATVIAAAVPLLLGYLYSTIRWRRFQQFASFPQVKPSWLWGHLAAMDKQIKTGGSVGDTQRHTDMVFDEMRESIGSPPIMFLDLRPVIYPVLVIASHELAEQVSKMTKQWPYSMPKSPTLRTISCIVGDSSLLITSDESWKSWRKIFNPSFAPQHLLTLLPCILDKTRIFLDRLDILARNGDEFVMSHYTTSLTFDIIGAVVMDIDFKGQGDEEHQSEVLRLFRALFATYTVLDDSVPVWLRPHHWYARRRLDGKLRRVLHKLVRDKFDKMKAEEAAGAATTVRQQKSRSVLSLSLKDTEELDYKTLDEVCDQVRTFLLAGHDTTSVLLQWALYELSRTPRAVAAIRAEIDQQLGPSADPDVMREQLLAHGDELASKLPYVSAVIKETLRLYPPAGSARMPPPGSGTVLTLPDGSQRCVDGMLLYLDHTAIQRDPAVYGDTADVFVPERWLGNTDTSEATNSGLHVNEQAGHAKADGKIPATAWRPFERGPRNCIGQELANIEARVILACVVKRYDFTKVGLGRLAVDADGQPTVNKHGQYEVDRALYNTTNVTDKPVDGCRMKLSFSDAVAK